MPAIPETGQPSSDPDLFAPILSGINAKTDAVVSITTGGGMGQQLPKDRLRVIPRYKPELASFNLGTMNFSVHPVAKRIKEWVYDWEEPYVSGTKDFIFRNTFGDMEVFGATFAEHNTRPEFEAYDVGHLYNLQLPGQSGHRQEPVLDSVRPWRAGRPRGHSPRPHGHEADRGSSLRR